MAEPARDRMTEEEYLEYDRTHEGKREFVNGEMIAMAGGSEAHSLLASNLHGHLFNALRGRPCRVHGSDLRVRIDETGLYAYPDLSVVCGTPEFAPTRPETLLNPSMVVEVLSESTASWDLSGKLAHYRRRPSIKAILLADSREQRVTLYVRNRDDTWTLSDHVGGTVSIPHLEVTLSMDELYDGVQEALNRAAANPA